MATAKPKSQIGTMACVCCGHEIPVKQAEGDAIDAAFDNIFLGLGLAGGGVLTGGAGWLYTTLIHDPQLVREASVGGGHFASFAFDAITKRNAVITGSPNGDKPYSGLT